MFICIFVTCSFLIFFPKREREREEASRGGAEREDRERIPNRPCSDSRMWTHELWDHELSRNRESEAQPTEPPWHPSLRFLFSNTWQHLSQKKNKGVEGCVMPEISFANPHQRFCCFPLKVLQFYNLDLYRRFIFSELSHKMWDSFSFRWTSGFFYTFAAKL